MEDLAIKNGILITPKERIRGGLTVSGGRISHIGDDNSLPKARKEINAQGLMVVPGLIDPHVHLGKNKEELFREQIRSESITAALGGITTLMTYVRFGNAIEPRSNAYRKAREIGRSSSFIDFKINAYMLNQNHLDEIETLMENGVNTFKLMMGYTAEEARQIGLEAINWGFAYKVFERVAQIGHPALAQIHCEEPEIIHMLRHRVRAEGREDLAAWTDSRPSACEAMQVYDAGVLAHELGTPLYIVHASAKESVDAIEHFKNKGTLIYGETCPHFLFLDKDAECGLLAKVNPPLRSTADQNRLVEGLRLGILDTVGSDHVPQMRHDKEVGGIWDSNPGFGGMGATLALLISEGVNKRKLTWEQLVKITSEKPARIFHIYPQKGALSPGSDADMVIVDPKKEWILNTKALQSSADYSVYEGRKVKGRAVKTFVRGQLITDNGRLVIEKPCGEYVFPSSLS